MEKISQKKKDLFIHGDYVVWQRNFVKKKTLYDEIRQITRRLKNIEVDNNVTTLGKIDELISDKKNKEEELRKLDTSNPSDNTDRIEDYLESWSNPEMIYKLFITYPDDESLKYVFNENNIFQKYLRAVHNKTQQALKNIQENGRSEGFHPFPKHVEVRVAEIVKAAEIVHQMNRYREKKVVVVDVGEISQGKETLLKLYRRFQLSEQLG